MSGDMYDTLAAVYDWLIPDSLLEPQSSVSELVGAVDRLPQGARVLDCAAGTGQLAVGLALRGFEVVASDASRAMIERTRELADRYHVEVQAKRCRWLELNRQGWQRPFDAVLCVGNSLSHAAGPSGRRRALAAMRAVLREGGLLVVSSRNWEQLRQARPRVQVADQLVERDGRRGLVVYAWSIPEVWDEPHFLDVAVAVIGQAGHVTTHGERLTFSPFTHLALDADLRSAGLTPVATTYAPHADRYVVTASN